MNFIMHGIGGNQREHLRQQFPQEKKSIFRDSGTFEGKVVSVPCTDVQCEEWDIDGVVRIKTVSEFTRSAQESFWQGLHEKSNKTFAATLITGSVLLTGAIALGVLVPPFLAVAVIIGAIALPILGFSFFMLYRRHQAEEQLLQWKQDPVSEVCRLRTEAGKQGFTYVFENNLKGYAVSNAEARDKYLQKMSDYVLEFQNTETNVKSSQVRDFMKTGLLKNEKVDYAFGKEVLPTVMDLQAAFKPLLSQYMRLSEFMNKQKKEIRKIKQEQLHSNDLQREVFLAPIKKDYEQRRIAINEAILTTDLSGGIRQVPGIDQKRCLQIQLRQIEQMFESLTRPIHALHALNKSKIENWAHEELLRIEASDDRSVECFYEPIARLLQHYEGAVAYQNAPIVDFNIPVPSAPLLEEANFRYDRTHWNQVSL